MQSRWVRYLLLWSLAGTAALALLAWAAWMLILTTPESRAVSAAVNRWIEQTSASVTARNHVLTARFTIEEVEGISKDLAGRSAETRWQAPDRLTISLQHDGLTLLAGRNGNEAWVRVPEKQFALLGKPDVPRFTGYPDSVQPVNLPDLSLPAGNFERSLLPALIRARKEDNGRWTITPSSLGRRVTGAPDFQLEVAPGTDPQRALETVEARLPDGKRLKLRFDELHLRPEQGAEKWSLPSQPGDTVEKVALSHLTQCLETMNGLLGEKAPALPPAVGKHELAGVSGKGRLELHDGVRVLFLNGTPEEMGRQHGELLRNELRQLNRRLLYGLGVTFSFPKGRWFFGEIEEAQSRLEPHTPELYLREMDALAEAGGLHRQEMRLASFFPELFHCSGFALHGSATVDGQMYHGRVLDYLRGVGLEENAVVMIYQPDGRNAWVNVSYAGFIGSVTAMNEKHLAIGEMGGRGEGNWDGMPMAQLVREVMETCDTVEEAVELMRNTPRTCEYYYVISDAKSMKAVGIRATPVIFETVWSGETHPLLPEAVEDAVLLSAGDRYTELVRRVRDGHGRFDAESARDLMKPPVCMTSNIQSVLFAPGTLDFWVANADSERVASEARYTKFNLGDLLRAPES